MLSPPLERVKPSEGTRDEVGCPLDNVTLVRSDFSGGKASLPVTIKKIRNM
jgi:hypothetical protein